MQKFDFGLPFIGLDRDEAANMPIYQQIYARIRRAILSGECHAGMKLPSTRELAQQLCVARTTVVNAYDQLFAEGYLEGRTGAGTFVCATLPDEFIETRSDNLKSAPKSDNPARVNLSKRAEWVLAANAAAILRRHSKNSSYAFRHGLPAVDQFPFEVWSRLVARRWRNPLPEMLAYGNSVGYRPLRETIAAYLKTARAVNCEPEQVIIVAGAQQALDLAARVLLDPGDAVWIEDPSYCGARGALVAAGARVFGVPVDDEGLDLAEALKTNEQPRLVYVTPSHQMPLGVTMSLGRRLALLDWAQRSETWVIEDDYDSEFRYSGRPLASLQGLDSADRTLYVGTFSKTIFPSLRLGCLVVPKQLIEIFTAARVLSDLQSPTFDQAVLNDFIAEGHFTRHIRRMRSLYKERQEILVHEAKRELAGLVEVTPDDAGLHLVGWLPENVCDRCAAKKAQAHGVSTEALSTYSERKLKRGGLILGYAAVDERQIKDGVEQLARALA